MGKKVAAANGNGSNGNGGNGKVPTYEQTRAEMLRTLRETCAETSDTPLSRYVIALTSDHTPMRLAEDGQTVGLVGRGIYSTDSEAHAQRVADQLNKRYEALSRYVIALTSDDSEAHAQRVADQLNKRYKALRTRCMAVVRLASAWRTDRLMVLQSLAESI